MSLLDYFKTPNGLKELEPDGVQKRSLENVTLIDVRSNSEYNNGHIDGSIHIPMGQIKSKMNDLDKNKEYVLICATGHRSRNSGAKLIRVGFKNVSHLKGGMNSWKKHGKKTVK
ncbi:MAG: rhodanese-like domain-containing protein [Cuniculiplasma sp.]